MADPPPPLPSQTETDIPGTIYLIDKTHTQRTAHLATSSSTSKKQDILLIPQPLPTARDPLNWPRYKKYWALFLASLFACVMAFGENNLGAAWETVSEEAHVSIQQLNGGSAVNQLLLGFCNLVWVPTAMKFGRKGCYIGAMTLNMVSMIWNTYFNGAGGWYGLCILGGFGTAAYEAIIQLTVFDIFFTHERGTMLAVYIWGMQLGSILGLILGGYISDAVGWRFSCSIGAILSGIVIALFLFTFDDSLFPRHIFHNTFEGTTILPEPISDQANPASTSESEKAPNEKAPTELTRQVTTAAGMIDLPARTYLEVLNPIHRFPADKTKWTQYFFRPFALFLFPNVVLAGLIFAFAATAGIVSFNTISEIMTEPPYSWSDGAAGLMFLGALAGSIIGMLTANVGDRIVLLLARRNGGYKEPEMRLWTLSIAFLYAAVGYFAYGWGAQEGASWPCIAIGLGAMVAQQVTATSVATAYAMECFEGIAGELIVVLACCSSVINFAISESVQPFVDAAGYGWTFTFFGICVLGSLGLAVPLMIWGKSWRRKCKGRYVRFIAQGVGFGMG